MESCGDIQALTEGCIANMLSLTTPVDSCRLSAVSPTFCSAAQSDTVWERLLPSDYLQIISSATDGQVSLVNKFHRKKDLYLYLCDNPTLIDEGRKSFWLERRSGKKCYMLAAKDLFIVWATGDTPQYLQWISHPEYRCLKVGDAPQYWQWISHPESRFPEAAELRMVCWLEIRGMIHTSMLSPGTKYAAYIVYRTSSSFNGFEHHLIELSVCMTGQEGIPNFVSMVPLDGQNPPADPEKHPKRREDGWLEAEIGEFLVLGGEKDGDLEMILKGMHGGNWKCGIMLSFFY